MGVLMAIPAFLMISRAGFFLDPSLKDAKDFNSSKLVWILVYLCQTIRTVSSLSAFTSCFIMIANSAPNELRGSVNGIAQSLGSLAQMAGPILGGNVFSFSLEIHHPSNETTADFSYWIDLHLIFYLLTACALTTFFISLKVPASVIKRRF